MSNLRKALMYTAIPIVGLSLISMAGVGEYMMRGVHLVWVGAAALWVIAIITAIVIIFKGRKDMASGIFAGIGIGIVALGATCFANLNMARWG